MNGNHGILFMILICCGKVVGCKEQTDTRSDSEILRLEAEDLGLEKSEQEELNLVAEECRKESGRSPMFARIVKRSGSEVTGFLIVSGQRDGKVRISGPIRGLKPDSDHGFHIHETGNCSSSDAVSAGGHFNPSKHPHGAPGSETKHAGDLGNIKANARGTAWVNLRIEGIKIGDLKNKSFIIHRDPDDFKTQPTGNAGPRIGCGVISESEDEFTPRAPSEFVINLLSQPAPQPQLTGRLVVKSIADGIEIVGEVQGLGKNAEHAVHFHENSSKVECTGDFVGVGAHFNPSQKPHGNPSDVESHLGDLGNIKGDAEGKASLKLTRKGLKLDESGTGILGRAFIIHAQPDDFKTQSPPGNAGARIGCGIVK